jgi:hypothetical protein
VIAAYRQAKAPAARTLELIRVCVLALALGGWVMYPVELLLLGHWAKSWQSKIPFLLSVPGAVLTAWLLFVDRDAPAIRRVFVATMWIAVLAGALGAYYHVLWNFDGKVKWDFASTMKAAAGSRPVLAALAFTHMGVSGLAAIYRVEWRVQR